jgi:hypothetical protein
VSLVRDSRGAYRKEGRYRALARPNGPPARCSMLLRMSEAESEVPSDESPSQGATAESKVLLDEIKSPRARQLPDWASIAAGLAAVTLPFVAATLGKRQALGAALIAVALLAITIAVGARRDWMRVAATIVLALIVVLSGSVVIWGSSAWLGLTQEETITMINPSPGNPAAQPGCTQISFSGSLPSGDFYAVANREEGNPRYYFQGQVIQDPATHNWITKVQLGNGKPDSGKLFRIGVYVIPGQFWNYLTNALPPNGSTNWSSLVPPPDATFVGGIDVRRDYDNVFCSSGP